MPRTSLLIDWLSFTIPTTTMEPNNSSMFYMSQWQNDMVDYFGEYWNDLVDLLGDCIPQKGRTPYNNGLSFDGGIIAMHPNFDHMLFEFTGKGCQRLRDADLLDDIMKLVQERLTRVDLAVDIESDAKPTEIRKSGFSGRFRSHSEMISNTGETVYIGAKKSERYLRLYRYYEPHPRHKYLRFEFVFRKRIAREFVRSFIESGCDYRQAMSYCGQVYGIEHEVWDVRSEPLTVELSSPNRKNAGTLIWLTGTAAPAFQRLVKEQIITDPKKFLEEYFLCETEEKSI